MPAQTRTSKWAGREATRLAREADRRNPATLFDLLNASLIHAYTDTIISISDAGEKDAPIRYLKEFIDDRCFFEIGAYILFMLDVWHVSEQLPEACRTLFNYDVVPRFAVTFKTALRQDNLGQVLANRFDAYGSFIRSKDFEKLRFSLEQAVMWSKQGQFRMLETDKPQPLMIYGVQYDMAIQMMNSAILEVILPECEKRVRLIYSKLGLVSAAPPE